MNNWFTNAVTGAAAQLLITTNLNMSGVFQLNVSVTTLSTNGYTWQSMWGTTYFQMIHTSSNTWLIPATMTNFMFIPTPLITYPYPSVNWALMEIWDMHGNPVTRLDSRIQGSATNVADSTQGALFLPTPYNVGGYKVKLTTVTTDNVFAVYNETGTMVAETLPSLSVVRTNSTVRVHVSVGQPGRTYFLQASTSPSGGAWTNVTSGHVAGYTGLDPGFDYTEPASAFGRHYFRVMGQ